MVEPDGGRRFALLFSRTDSENILVVTRKFFPVDYVKICVQLLSQHFSCARIRAAIQLPEYSPQQSLFVENRVKQDQLSEEDWVFVNQRLEGAQKLLREPTQTEKEAFEAIKDEIKPGQTENYLAGLLIMELRSRGASGTSFPPIVATGANSSLPHYRPSDDKTEIEKDQACLLDWGAVLNGYCSDLTRTFLLGHVPHKIREIYKVVYDAQVAAIKFLRPGVTTRATG